MARPLSWPWLLCGNLSVRICSIVHWWAVSRIGKYMSRLRHNSDGMIGLVIAKSIRMPSQWPETTTHHCLVVSLWNGRVVNGGGDGNIVARMWLWCSGLIGLCVSCDWSKAAGAKEDDEDVARDGNVVDKGMHMPRRDTDGPGKDDIPPAKDKENRLYCWSQIACVSLY